MGAADPVVVRELTLVAIAIVPALLYLWYFRSLERFEREPWKTLFGVFLWGAFVAAAIMIPVAAVVFWPKTSEPAGPFIREWDYLYGSPPNLGFSAVLLVIAILPFSEELAKVVGLRLARKDMNELEDGLIYSIAAGLGFATFESILSEQGLVSRSFFFSDQVPPLAGFVALAFLRTSTSMVLHASAGALAGLGLSYWLSRKGRPLLIVCFLGAVAIHSLSNAFSWVDAYFTGVLNGPPYLLSLGLNLLLSFLVFSLVRARLKKLIKLMDAESQKQLEQDAQKLATPAPQGLAMGPDHTCPKCKMRLLHVEKEKAWVCHLCELKFAEGGK